MTASAHQAILNNIRDLILQPLVVLLFAVAFIVFFWGIFQFVLKSDNEEGRKTGARHMLWGLIGMVIMVSVWGIVAIIKNTIGI